MTVSHPQTPNKRSKEETRGGGGDMQDKHCRDEMLQETVLCQGPFRRRTRRRWGKWTGATLRHCSRCQGVAAQRQGFIVEPSQKELMFSLKKKARWRILDHVKKNKKDKRKKMNSRRANSRFSVRGYVDYHTTRYGCSLRFKRNRKRPAFVMKPKWEDLRLTQTQLDELLTGRKQKGSNIKKVQEDEDEGQYALYIISDPHLVVEDYRDAQLDHAGGHLASVEVGQDNWTIGPRFAPDPRRKELAMVIVVTNNSAQQGRWCCSNPSPKGSTYPTTPVGALFPDLCHNPFAYWRCRDSTKRVDQKRISSRRKDYQQWLSDVTSVDE